METVVIRGLDVGFGNVKYSVASSRDPGGVKCASFPSLVADPSASTAGAEVLSGVRHTVLVNVNGGVYEVGPDVEKAMGTREGRSLHRDYSSTDEYMALTYGALANMGVEHIDVLVVGLPVNAEPAKYAALQQKLQGRHHVTEKRTVDVRNVLVVAQPMGGFLDYAERSGQLRTINDQTSLLIDVGFFTVDFVVARGTEVISARAGGYDAGVSEMLKRINGGIKKDLSCEDISINRLDKALRDGPEGIIRIYGKPYKIGNYMNAAETAINEGLNAVQAKVGKSDDIDNIFICGGGAPLYLEAVKARYPRHEVAIVEDPMFSNVRGFSVLGEMRYRKLQRLKAA